MNIKPLSDRVVIKAVEAEEKTKAGILLTASAQEKPQVAEVVAVGPGARDDNGKLIPMRSRLVTRSSPASMRAPRSRWTARSTPSSSRATFSLS